MTQLMSIKARLPWRMSMPGLLLRLEGAAALAGALTLYAYHGYNWWVFALLLLVPDLSIAGYVAGTQVGSLVYNLIHTYTLPLVLALISFVADLPLGLQLALIWLAHISMDRTLGLGLKYATTSKDSHLSRV